MTAETDAAEQYFSTIAAALAGLEIFMRDDRSPLYRHGIVAKIVASYIARLEKSFSCWRNRLGFVETFKISRAESGFPVFQNVLELENDRRQANQRLASIPEADEIRNEMADFILRHKEFPAALQKQMAERLYLEDVKDGRSVQPVHAGRDGQGVGQSEDLPAVLSRPLGDLRRQRQPAADLHGDRRGFLRSDGRAAGRPGRQAQRQGRHPAAGRWIAQSRACPPLRRFHREELGLFAVAGDDRRQSRQGFRAAASQAAAPRRARAVLFGRHHREQFDGDAGAVQGAQAGKCLAADLDDPGGLLQDRNAPAARGCGRARRRRRSSSSTPTISKRRARACRATRSMR